MAKAMELWAVVTPALKLGLEHKKDNSGFSHEIWLTSIS